MSTQCVIVFNNHLLLHQGGSYPIYATNTGGTVYGGEQTIITGPQFLRTDNISCIFGSIATPGYYISYTRCLCIAPHQYEDGLMELKVQITRGQTVLAGATKYRYSKL